MLQGQRDNANAVEFGVGEITNTLRRRPPPADNGSGAFLYPSLWSRRAQISGIGRPVQPR